MKFLIPFFTLLAFGYLSLQMSSCTKEKVPLPSVSNPVINNCPDTISFQNQVFPMIDVNCNTSGCHDSGAGGYTLTNHSQISANAEIILKVIKHESGVEPMPQGQSKLADSLAQQFNCWISQGKADN